MPVAEKLIIFSAEAKRRSFRELREQRQDQPLALQIAKVALYKSISGPVMDRLARYFGDDYVYVGNGAEQIAFRSDKQKHVLKLLISTTGLSREEAEESAGVLQDAAAVGQSYLLSHWTSTEFRSVSLPFKKSAVAAVQPIVEPVRRFGNVDEVLTFTDAKNRVIELDSFEQGARRMHEETGMYPDILGPNNLVVSFDEDASERLQVLDTILETPAKLLEKLEDSDMTRSEAITLALDRWALAISASRESRASGELALH